MSVVTNLVNRALRVCGLKITRIHGGMTDGPYSALFHNRRVTELERLAAMGETIPGMLSEESGKFLYALCYTQQLEGDVVEIGSWQGYSTSFLARAVSDAGNGQMYAIDHFKGNVGKERFYVVDKADLSDLSQKFRENMVRLGLADAVKMLAMPNQEAAEQLRRDSVRVRFLFIDGDHSREGVRRDVDLFFPFLMKGSIVVFDDCSPTAPGVIEVIDELFRNGKVTRAFAYANTLVAVI
jgi:predicted O-methyltransferase YrrM